MHYMQNSQLYGLWIGSSGSGFQAAFMLTKGASAESFKLNIDWAFSTNSWDPSNGSTTLYFLKTAALIASLSNGEKCLVEELSSTSGGVETPEVGTIVKINLTNPILKECDRVSINDCNETYTKQKISAPTISWIYPYFEFTIDWHHRHWPKF